VTGLQKPILYYLKVYRYCCYILIKSAGNPDRPKKLRKLQPRAHIGFLIGYKSTSIYRIWILHKKKVISARDVLFDEDEFYNRKPIQLTAELISKLDKAVEQVNMPPDANQEDLQLRQDKAIAETDSDDQVEIPEDVNEREDVDDDHLEAGKEPGAAQTNWESMVYPTPDPTVVSTFLSNADICLPVKSEGVRAATSFAVSIDETFPDLPDLPDIEPAVIHELKRQQEDRFFDFYQYRVPQAWQTAFQAGSLYRQDCPALPKNYRELQGYYFESQFKDKIEKYINKYLNIFKFWIIVDKLEAKRYQIFSC
jgi:hypothetical protein